MLQPSARFIVFKLTLFALAPLLIWWFAIFPGYFSPDSGGIITQVRTGKWDNWHTTSYVFFVAVTSALGTLPALSIFCQAVFFAFAIAKLYFVLQPEHVWMRKDFFIISGFTLMPQVAGFVLTLWKDPVYASFAILMTSAFIEQGRKVGAKFWTNPILWVIAVFGVSAFRWNGFITAIAALGTGVVSGRLPRNPKFLVLNLVVVSLAVASLILIPKVAPVAGVDWLFFNSPKLHDISVLIAKDSLKSDKNQSQLLEDIMPVSEWRNAGASCRSHDTLIFSKFPENRTTSYPAIYSSTKALDELWLQNVIAQPLNVLSIRFCRAESSISPIPSSENLPPGLWFQDNQEIPGLNQIRLVPLATDVANLTLALISTNWILQWGLLHAPVWLLIYSSLTIVLHKKSQRPKSTYALETITVSLAILISSAASAVAQDLRYTMAATLILQLATLVVFRKLHQGRTEKYAR